MDVSIAILVHPHWWALPTHNNQNIYIYIESNIHFIPYYRWPLIAPTSYPAKVSLIYCALLQMGWSSRPLGTGLSQLLLNECWHSWTGTVETTGKWGISLSSIGESTLFTVPRLFILDQTCFPNLECFLCLAVLSLWLLQEDLFHSYSQMVTQGAVQGTDTIGPNP